MKVRKKPQHFIAQQKVHKGGKGKVNNWQTLKLSYLTPFPLPLSPLPPLHRTKTQNARENTCSQLICGTRRHQQLSQVKKPKQTGASHSHLGSRWQSGDSGINLLSRAEEMIWSEASGSALSPQLSFPRCGARTEGPLSHRSHFSRSQTNKLSSSPQKAAAGLLLQLLQGQRREKPFAWVNKTKLTRKNQTTQDSGHLESEALKKAHHRAQSFPSHTH